MRPNKLLLCKTSLPSHTLEKQTQKEKEKKRHKKRPKNKKKPRNQKIENKKTI